MLTSFANILDRLVVQNNYNRELLLSGDDGFEFYDDINKRNNQLCRILHLENDSTNDIASIILNTSTRLENNDTNETVFYSTHNVINLLRAKECIDIRIANQEQFEKIVKMNEGKISSELVFDCKIEYSTQAKQQVTYRYKTRIINDKRIDILEDGVERVVDDVTTTNEKSTPFRNLQDEISTIDRNSYAWEKMTRTMLTVMEQSGLQQFKNKENKLMTSNPVENTVNSENTV